VLNKKYNIDVDSLKFKQGKETEYIEIIKILKG
jgi:hypothetical protein